MSEENHKKPKEILENHKKVGKSFIPPIMQLEKLKLISYVHRLLPEIAWVGLINHSLGYQKGIDLCLRLARYAKEIHSSEQFINFALASAYSLLNDNEVKQLIECLRDAEILEQLRRDLSPLTLYEGFPMSFIGEPTSLEEKHLLVARLKEVIGALMNKYNLPGMAAQTAVMYIRGVTGGLYFPVGFEAPDLNAIIIAPDSEAGKYAASFVRANVLGEIRIPGIESSDEWAAAFWNQGIKIADCDFGDSND